MDLSKVDLHTHTVASGHAFSTLQEMAAEAARKGVEVLGVTEHCNPAKIPGVPADYYFWAIERVPKEINGVRCLMGVEANIINAEGKIDLADDLLANCNPVIASIHRQAYDSENNVENNTNAFCGAIENKRVQIIGHPAFGMFPCDIAKVAEAAATNEKFLEINASHFKYAESFGTGPKAVQAVRKMVEATKKNKWYNVVNSDAHISFDIADFEAVTKLARELALDEKNLVNSNAGVLEEHFLTR